MAEHDNVHPGDTGADEDARIWAELEAAEQTAVAGDEPEPTPADPEPAPPAAEPAKPEAKTTTGGQDIWEGAPEPLRAAYQATRQQLEQTDQNYRRVSGTVSALQRQVNELKVKPATPQQAAATANFLESPAFKKAKDEYPEVIGPLEGALRALSEKTDALGKQVTQRLDTVDQREADAYYTAQQNVLEAKHPDWLVVTGRPDFTQWLERQPRFIREGIERNGSRIVDGDEAASIIGLFKASLPPPAAQPQANGQPQGATQTQPSIQADNKRRAQLESAHAPKGRGTGTRLTSGVPDGSDEEIWGYWDEQERRQARNR